MNRLIYTWFWKFCQRNPDVELCDLFPALKGIHKHTKLKWLMFAGGVVHIGNYELIRFSTSEIRMQEVINTSNWWNGNEWFSLDPDEFTEFLKDEIMDLV